MYADSVTQSMENAIMETERRRKLQMDFNEAHGIVPQTIIKDVREVIEISTKAETDRKTDGAKKKRMTPEEREAMIKKLTEEMKNAAKILEFEHAAYLRDKINELKEAGKPARALPKKRGK